MKRPKNPTCVARRTQTSVRMLLRAGMPEPGRFGSSFCFFGGGTNFFGGSSRRAWASGAGAGTLSPSAPAASSGFTAPTSPFHGIGSTGA
jgi:hypothetical protein